MRSRFALSAFLLLCVTALPAFAQWDWGRPHPPQVGACFYRVSDFRGDYFCLKEGERWPSLPPGFNDRISSIRVFNGARLRVFNDDDFDGISALIDHDVNDLRAYRLPERPDKSWNDRISSIAVFRERDEWERHDHDRGPFQGHDSRPSFPEAGACFFVDADYRGESFCMREGERSTVVPPGFNDRISSIRVFGGARVRIFNDSNFGGISMRIDHDADNLQAYRLPEHPDKSWNDRISSIAVFRDHDDWERREGPPRY